MDFRSWRGELNESETEIIRACLWAAVEGPFFADDTLRIVTGFDRDLLRSYANSWPASADEFKEYEAVSAVLLNLRSYPHRKDAHWTSWIPVDREALEELDFDIREACGAGDAMRLRLKSEFVEIMTWDEETLQERIGRVTSVTNYARRLQMDIPRRLSALVPKP